MVFENSTDDFWLFGYGSLIWKPPPHFGIISASQASSLVLFDDFGSEDHRGTPENPGRVVTLIERSFWKTLNDSASDILFNIGYLLRLVKQHQTEQDRVWGVAYHIVPDKVKEVQEYLDIREINGYSIQYTAFHPAVPDMKEIRCLVYIGMPDNPQFLGALDPQDVALKINESVGPSGANREYLLELEHALTNLSPASKDEHITDLAQRVVAMSPPSSGGDTSSNSHKHNLSEVKDADEQEEVEKVI